MAIRDKVTIKFKGGGKAFVSEVKRPGGLVEAKYDIEGFVRVAQMTRKEKELEWAAYSLDEVKSIEFQRGT